MTALQLIQISEIYSLYSLTTDFDFYSFLYFPITPLRKKLCIHKLAVSSEFLQLEMLYIYTFLHSNPMNPYTHTHNPV